MLDEINGTSAEVDIIYLIRDFFKDSFNEKKKILQDIVDFLNKKYGQRIELEIEDSYYNMKEKIKPCMEIVELAKKSIKKAGMDPIVKPIRGGTDGASLSYKGLPTPNLFTGGYNFHGRYELLSVDIMEKSFEVLKNIVQLNVKEEE